MSSYRSFIQQEMHDISAIRALSGEEKADILKIIDVFATFERILASEYTDFNVEQVIEFCPDDVKLNSSPSKLRSSSATDTYGPSKFFVALVVVGLIGFLTVKYGKK